VDHVLGVAVPEGAGELEDVLGGLPLAETALGLEVLVELAAGAVLEDQVDALVVEEVAVEAEDVDVAEVRLDLNLPAELVLDPGLEELGLLEDLEGDNVVGGLLQWWGGG
jgi:hypothetical protein